MDQYDGTLDVSFCLRKEVEYYAKARATNDPDLKSAYEATAREYAAWARQLGQKQYQLL